MPTEPYRHRHRVTYGECTLGNHVYYARYLELLEEARGEFFRAHGFPLRQLQDNDLAFPVLQCHLHFHAPARYDDVLTLETCVSLPSPIRLQFDYRILDPSDRLLVTASTLHVSATLTEKPRKMPRPLREAMRRAAGEPTHSAPGSDTNS